MEIQTLYVNGTKKLVDYLINWLHVLPIMFGRYLDRVRLKYHLPII